MLDMFGPNKYIKKVRTVLHFPDKAVIINMAGDARVWLAVSSTERSCENRSSNGDERGGEVCRLHVFSFSLCLHMNVLLHISSPHFKRHCKDGLKTPGQCEKPSRFLKGP